MREVAIIHRDPLTHEALRDTIDLALWAGQLLMSSGAETSLVERTVHRLGTGLGCDWLDVFVSPNAVTITASSGVEFRTKTRRIVTLAVNMSTVASIVEIVDRVQEGYLHREGLRQELRRIADTPRAYPRWLVVIMVGLACGAFSRLFDGDWAAFFMTWGAASTAMFVRQQLLRRQFNNLLVAIVTAFVAGVVAGTLVLTGFSETTRATLAASVLLLVPGVPLINSAEDLIKGYTIVGVARGVTGGLLSLCIGLGLLTAISILGVRGS